MTTQDVIDAINTEENKLEAPIEMLEELKEEQAEAAADQVSDNSDASTATDPAPEVPTPLPGLNVTPIDAQDVTLAGLGADDVVPDHAEL